MVKRSALVHNAFIATIAIKGFDGGIELLAGFIVAIVGSQRLYSFLINFTAPELASNPGNLAAHFVQHTAQGLAHASNLFVIVYLLVHGILKLAITINLLRGKSWIFPIATVILLGFVAFMSYRLTVHWSDWLLAFAIFDAITVALVINEWRNVTRT